MIEIFEGRLGGGKTYTAVTRIVKALSEGRMVFTNVALNWDAIKHYAEKRYGVVLQDDQVSLLEGKAIRRFIDHISRDSLVCIDEAHLWFNARDWSTTDREVLAMLTQSRKIKVDVIFISQSANNIDKQFMRLVQYVWRFRDMSTFFILPGLKWPDFVKCVTFGTCSGDHIVQAQYDYDGRTRLNRFWVKKDKEIFALYNTNALLSDVAVKDGIGTRKLDKVTKKKSGMMKFVVPVVLLVIIGAVVLGAKQVMGMAHPDAPKAGPVSSSVVVPGKGKVEEFWGAQVLRKRARFWVCMDHFRLVHGQKVCTKTMVWRKGEQSAAGEVLASGANGVKVKTWDGVVVLILPDPSVEQVEASEWPGLRTPQTVMSGIVGPGTGQPPRSGGGQPLTLSNQ